MKRIVILSLILTCSLSVFSQGRDSIIYVFPDTVEVLLHKRVNEFLSRNENYSFSFYLERVTRDTFRLFLNRHRNDLTYSDWTYCYWARNTNRFILINDRKYPLYFDYDVMFSPREPERIGDFGERFGGLVPHLRIMHRGYNITFDRWGRVALENWGEWDMNNRLTWPQW